MRLVIVEFKNKSRLPLIGELIDDSEDQIIICHIGIYDNFHKDKITWSTDDFWKFINKEGFPILKEHIESYYNPSQTLCDYFLSHYQEHC